jgi:quinol-cytochrome oxidoreductase complex cytochrome b subunit
MQLKNLYKTFLFHLRPRFVRAPAIRFTYTFGLGGSAAALVALLMMSGVLLKFFYTPVPERAYDAIVSIQNAVPFGQFIRNIHHWSANLLVFVVFLHMIRVFFTCAYRTRRKLNWLVGLILFIAVLLSNFTGYLLPWDQLSYWAVTICASMLTYIPGVGRWLQHFIIGGDTLGPQTLYNFYAWHTAIMPAVLILLLPFHFWRIRKAGGLAAACTDKPSHGHTPEKIDVIPHLIVRELAMGACVMALVMIMASLWDAPLAAKANPGLSPNPTKAPWYFAGLQETLIYINPRLAVTVVFPAVLLSLVAMPFLPSSKDVSGLWFGSLHGRRMAIAAALSGMLLTPMWVMGCDKGLCFLVWLVPLATIVIMIVVNFVFRRRFGVTVHESVQAFFSFLLVVFIILTITGVWFRGASMALVWPL